MKQTLTTNEQAVQSLKDAMDPTIHHLTSAIAAKQSALADLEMQVEKATEEANRRIEAVRQSTEARKAELTALLEPLESKRDAIIQVDATLSATKRKYEEETSRLKEIRSKELATLREQADRESHRLNAMQDAIAKCKHTVAIL